MDLRQRVWEHHVRGDAAAPKEADKPGEENSGVFDSAVPFAVSCLSHVAPEPPLVCEMLITTMGTNRRERCRVPQKILCEGLCWESLGIQSVTGLRPAQPSEVHGLALKCNVVVIFWISWQRLYMRRLTRLPFYNRFSKMHFPGRSKYKNSLTRTIYCIARFSAVTLAYPSV